MKNMPKNKNNSGFTLVELIVVMCIMGIIMGAVLNVLRPTAQLYNTTNKYLNQEEAVAMISDYLEDDLMYATGVCICYSNNGNINEVVNHLNTVPEGVNIGLEEELKFNNCIMFDNVSVRTSGTTAAVRKEAKGTISKYALKDGSYVDVASDTSLLQGNNLYKNTFALQDQSFMGEDQYNFTVGYAHTGDLYSLTVHMDVASLAHDAETDTYKPRPTEFSADKAIELVNISSGVVTAKSSYHVIDWYEPGNKYTYVFYDRKDKVAQQNVRFTCEFYLMGADGKYMTDPIYTTTTVEPANLQEEVQKNVDVNNLEVIETDTHVYRRTKYYATMPNIHDINDPTVVDLTNITADAPGVPKKLYAVYTKTLKADEKVTVNFYSDQTKSSLEKQVPDREFGADISSQVPVWEGTEQDAAGTTFTVKYWANCDTGERQLSFSHVTSNMDVYRASHTEYKVSFVKQDGSPAEWTDADGNLVDYIRVREGEAIPASQIPDALLFSDPADGSGNYSWVFDGGPYDGQPVDNTKVITQPMTIKLKFELIAEPTPTPPPSGGEGSGGEGSGGEGSTPPNTPPGTPGTVDNVSHLSSANPPQQEEDWTRTYYSDEIKGQVFFYTQRCSYNISIVNNNTPGDGIEGALLGGTYEITLNFDNVITDFNTDSLLGTLMGINKITNYTIDGGKGQNFIKITFDLYDISVIKYDPYYTDYSKVLRPNESINFSLYNIIFNDTVPNCTVDIVYNP